MDTLRVRTYDVRFGDAVLVTVPDRDPATGEVTRRHILIDVGNVYSGDGGDDTVFHPIMENVLQEVAQDGVDLYVMTHEHMDHVQGLPYVAKYHYPEGELKQQLAVRHAWLTASAEAGYYQTHPDARREFDAIERFLKAAPRSLAREFHSILMNNSPYRTAECVNYAKELADHTHYVHRETDLQGKHDFKEARFSIWAPEEDTSEYYGHFRPMALGMVEQPNGAPASLTQPRPPAGVDARDFYNLVRRRQSGFIDNILAIDKAKNNTSLVFCLEWRGWRLLFTGDAEIRSWKTILREHNNAVEAGGQLMEPVHFLKVSHHGSHNGTPKDEILDVILPPQAPDDRKRYAVISSDIDTYSGIPHDPTNERLTGRCPLSTTVDHPGEGYIDTTFPDDAHV